MTVLLPGSRKETSFSDPLKNRKTNSWELGTFQVGHKYQFEIVDFNPVNAIWPHKREDILVQTDPPPVFQ